MSNIRDTFDELCPDFKADKELLTKISKYERWFVNKNQHHINFFGGVLMGVDPVRFTTDDRAKWFDTIIGTDEFIIREKVHKLPTVNTKWIVSSDIMNLSCIWVMHRILSSKLLNDKDKEKGATDVAKIMNYKFFSSILTGWFRYQANEAVAQTTYTMLNKKFGLKVVGSWGELINKRSYDIVKKGGLHHNKLFKMDPDKDIIDMTNDIWGRVKSILKYIRDVFTQAQNLPDYQIQTVGNTINLDGEIKYRDRTRMITKYMDYILQVISDKRSFRKTELENVILSVITNSPQKSFSQTLDYVVNISAQGKQKDVEDFTTLVVEHGINYIVANPGTMRNQSDLAGLIRKMKGLYTAAKSIDPQVLKMRTLGDDIVRKATSSRNQQVITAARNALALYIILRTMVMNHYSK